MNKIPSTEIKKKKRIKRPRLPNGFGSITTLSGNRRNPYWARKTTGFDPETGFPMYKTIGYFPEWIDAFQALSDYNKNPYDIDLSNIVFSEVYEKWSIRKFNEIKNGKKLSPQSIQSYKSSYKHCSSLYNFRFADLNTMHLQNVIDNCERGRATLENIKLLFNQLYKYAIEFGIVAKDYSQFVVLTKADNKSKKRAIPDKDVREILKHIGTDGGDLAAILLYSGMRINELMKIKTENIFIDQGYMIGGLKTQAGIDRVIPIHSTIKPIIQRRLNDYDKLYDYVNDSHARVCIFTPFMQSIGFDYLPHECRHTFISKSDAVGMKPLARDIIVGHTRKNLAEKVYTHKTIEELQVEIEKINY